MIVGLLYRPHVRSAYLKFLHLLGMRTNGETNNLLYTINILKLILDFFIFSDEVQDFKLTEGTIEPLISNGNQKPMIIEKGSIATEK